MRKVKLTKAEKAVEDHLEEYVDVSESEFQEAAQTTNTKKDPAS